MTDPVKLIAQTTDDLTILSTLVQDMTIRVEDLAWLPAKRRFAAIGNRYRWEKKRRFLKPKGERVRAAFHFNGILKAEISGLNLSRPDDVLNLLSIEAERDGEDIIIVFSFAEGATIRLKAECVDAVLSDLSAPWDAIARPSHA